MQAREWIEVVRRAGKETVEDHMILIAQALAFSTFLAIPSVLLVVIGLFTLVASGATIDGLITDLHGVVPGQARQLLSDSLHRLDHTPATSVTVTVIGFVIALWSTTSAMSSYMTALDLAFDRTDNRSFLKRRLVALGLVACLGVAFVLVAGLLMFGPPIQEHVGRSLGHERAVAYVWWIVQWPILVLGLLAVFASLLYLGPDVERRSWRMATPGAVVAVLVWLAASGLFAVYTSRFDSYNKAWGSLAAVIVMLVWLWLAALALLFGAELDSEIGIHEG